MMSFAGRLTGSRSVALAVVAMVAASILPVGAGVAAAPKDEVILHTATGAHPITVEWAITEAEHERGLMFRTSMPLDRGMIFVFDKEAPVAFWMHNTPLPLDMIFIAGDGTVKRIEKRAKPNSDTIIPSGAPVSYVLEVNGGVSDKMGLAVGDRVEIPAH